MSAEKIVNDLKKQQFKPVYWLEGEEEFFIDRIITYAEQRILTEAEAGFNLMVFYGRDAQWTDILNACRRYPMFAERQVVILKEAQGMKDIDKLESYIEKPSPTTLFFVAYKNKKVDGRTKLSKLLKEKAVHFSSKKLYDKDLPEWTSNLVKSKGFTISSKALFLLIDHIGNDLNRPNNEFEKLSLNLEGRENITEEDIEKFVGISKDYNVFELQQALANKDLYKAVRIIQYFAANPKAAPIQLILPSLYGYFSKVLAIYNVNSRDEKLIAATTGIPHFFVKEYMQTAVRYSQHEIEKVLLLLYEYNLRTVGVNDAGTDDADLLKEMVVKMIAA
ncbi:MAG TPA: DNA polymerase III subunit delta [Flavisolibacter sp.]|nr:DNA polymerase III subunit delta [Flavisolibacter sp.]